MQFVFQFLQTGHYKGLRQLGYSHGESTSRLEITDSLWFRDTQFSSYVRSIQKGKEHLRLVRLDHIGRAFIQHGGERKNEEIFNLDPISRPTFMKFIDLVTKEVEKKVSEKLPEKFGIIIDGLSDMNTCSYYLGVFACFRHDEVTECPLLTFSVLNNEVDHTAQNQGNFLEDVIAIYGKSRESLAFIVSDNERTNKKISDTFGLNKIGFFGHRLNLAVEMFLGEYTVIIQKVHNLMKKLTILKYSAQLGERLGERHF